MQLAIEIPKVLEPEKKVAGYLEDTTPVEIDPGDVEDLIESLKDLKAEALLRGIAKEGVLVVEAAGESYRVSAGRETLILGDVPTGIAAWAASDDVGFDS